MKHSSRTGTYWRFLSAVTGLLVLAALVLAPSRVEAKCLGTDDITDVVLPAGCLTANDGTVVRMRLFRADLVVAALTCDTKRQYNLLVARHQDELVRGGKALRNLFSRLHKEKASRELDRFVTHLTNRASIRRLSARGYCGAMARVYEQAMKLPSNSLRSYVLSRPVTSAIRVVASANDR